MILLNKDMAHIVFPEGPENPYPGQNLPDCVIVHHSAVGGFGPQFAGINESHHQRGFPKSNFGFYVGYHYLIEKDGSVFQARDEREGGAHTRGKNFSSIGVCLSGNFDVENPPAAQVSALAGFLRNVLSRYNLAPSVVFPHRRFNPTSCYGLRLDDDWVQRVYLEGELTWFQSLLLWLKNRLK